ncbi:hypothetical protein DPMN_135517 [Dreissena polymorpha]|uniref:Uncharacterized protein n=1 Tax=Dreissena polymorpha TaxID=45954 RepID=A0A9D4JER4_DREPO|nr:hypothetical protein DPMN_135517 [Dreissena polymorpha]
MCIVGILNFCPISSLDAPFVSKTTASSSPHDFNVWWGRSAKSVPTLTPEKSTSMAMPSKGSEGPLNQ